MILPSDYYEQINRSNALFYLIRYLFIYFCTKLTHLGFKQTKDCCHAYAIIRLYMVCRTFEGKQEWGDRYWGECFSVDEYASTSHDKINLKIFSSNVYTFNQTASCGFLLHFTLLRHGSRAKSWTSLMEGINIRCSASFSTV